MRKVLMLALLVLGTASFASVKPIAVKGKATSAISVRKHKKHVRQAKKVEATPAATPAKK